MGKRRVRKGILGRERRIDQRGRKEEREGEEDEEQKERMRIDGNIGKRIGREGRKRIGRKKNKRRGEYSIRYNSNIIIYV